MSKKFFKWIVPIFLIFGISLVFAENNEKPWDFLRPLTEIASSIDNITKAVVLVFSLGLFAISFLAYKKVKSQKLLIVTLAFGLFALKWVFAVSDIFFSPGQFFSDPAQNVLELIVFVLLFWAIFKK